MSVSAQDIQAALDAAGIASGERFEVAVKPVADEPLRGRLCASVAEAAAWLALQPEGDRYIGVNPMKADANPPHGRARDCDVALVRVLVLDVDPGDPPRGGAKQGDDDGDAENVAPFKRAAAREVAGKLAEAMRAQGHALAVVDSGRGIQVWVRHEPLEVTDPELVERSRVLRRLADAFNRPGLCHVDVRVGNLARLARLPGTTNTKTGELAKIVEQAAAGATARPLASLAELGVIEKRPATAATAAAPIPPATVTVAEAQTRLELANAAMGAARLAAFFEQLGFGEVRVIDADKPRVELSCPARGPKCGQERFSAYAYPRVDGGPAFVHCSHLDSCGRVVSVWDLALEAANGSSEDAQELIARAAGLPPEESDEPILEWLDQRVNGPRGSASGKPLTKKGRSRPLSDVGNVDRFAERHGADLRYAPRLGRNGWFAWDGKRWIGGSEGAAEAERRGKRISQVIALEARALMKRAAAATGKRKEVLAKRAEEMMKHSARSESEPRIRALMNLARSESAFHTGEGVFDADPRLLNCENGTLELLTASLRDHRREDYITKMAPVAFDPEAAAPEFETFVHRIMGGNLELVGFLQRTLGYALTGLAAEQALFIFYGEGANGKSTLLEAIRAVLGDYAMTADFGLLMHKRGDGPRNDIARLRGARLVTAIETNEGHRFDEAVVKQLSGSDTIAARMLYAESTEFRPTFKIVMATNHKPEVRGADVGIWRRLKLVPFAVTIPEGERDPKLLEKLLAERSGILAWCVRGCLEWQAKGLGEPPEVKQATAEYRESEDPLAAFMDENLERGPGFREDASTVFAAYATWCKATKGEPLTLRAFNKRLKARLGSDPKRSGCRGQLQWEGIRLVGLSKQPQETLSFDNSSSRAGALRESSVTERRTEQVPSVTPGLPLNATVAEEASKW